MNAWKLLLIALAVIALLWFLNPERALKRNEPGLVEIVYLSESGPDAGSVEEAMREFEAQSRAAHQKDPAHPIYRIIKGHTASRDPTADPTRFLVSLAGGTPPDLILFDRYAVSEWAARGAFTRLDEFVAREASNPAPDAIRPENFYKSCWDEVVYENPTTHERGIYGIPEHVDDRALFYNKDLLKRAGFVDANGEAQPPRTWGELEQMAIKLTEHDARGRITQLGFAPNYGNAWLYLYSWMNGGWFMSDDRRQCTLNSPAVVQALEWMTRVYDSLGGAQKEFAFEGTAQSGQRSALPGELDLFVQGKVAMKIDGYWTFPEVLAQYGQNLNYAVTLPPLPASAAGKENNGYSWVSGWCYAIPSTARQKEGAWELLKFMCSQHAREIIGENERLRLQSIGRIYVPTQNANRYINEWEFQKYIASDPTIPAKLRDGVKLLNDLIDTSPFRPVTPVGQLLFNEQKRATENAIFHKMSPQEALNQSTAVVQGALDRALSPPRGVVVPWKYFLAVYFVLLAGAAVGIYFWDTRVPSLEGRALSRPKLRDTTEDVPPAHSQVARVQNHYFRTQWRGGWLCALPWIVGFILFTGGPILFAVVVSFCDYDILSPARFVGLANYRWMFSRDPLFWKVLGNTVYMIVGIPLGMALSLAIALLLNLEVRGVAIWRTFFYLPSIVPAVASSILWIWIFNPQIGLLNNVLAAFGIHGPNWLQDEHTSKIALILMGLWCAGGGMIIWLAGLKGISASYYEAAALDGANAWQRFRTITLPLLTPYIFFNLIMGLIATLQIFTQSFIMTQGGPIDSTLFYAYHLFNHAFRFLQMGYARAVGWFLVLAVFALTLLQLTFSKRWVHYEE
jgi:ABC-type sugar transport system permease subunit/ABC-type glycerol-3-phosphate transport system substrate-binding protein